MERHTWFYCSKPYCKLSFRGSYPKLLMCYCNLNIFSCRTLNNFNKLFVIVSYLIQNKRIDYISNIMSKRLRIFTESFTSFFSNAAKTENLRGIRILEILEDHLLEISIYM